MIPAQGHKPLYRSLYFQVIVAIVIGVLLVAAIWLLLPWIRDTYVSAPFWQHVVTSGQFISTALIPLGIVLGARSAGIAKKSIVFLLYPLISVAICIAADTSIADPWGMSWLWVAAILGPVLGARTVLNPSPRDHDPAK